MTQYGSGPYDPGSDRPGPYDSTPYGQPTAGQQPYGQPTAAQQPYGQPTADQQPYGQPTAAQQPMPGPYAGANAGWSATQHGQPYPMQLHQGAPYLMPPEHPQGTTILVLGIVSLMIPILGFVPWYMGSKTQREIDETGAVYSNTGNITAGKIIGMITGILSIVSVALVMLYLILFFVVFAGMMSSF